MSDTYGEYNGQIRFMADEDKPREKAMRCGVKTLTDAELMAIVFSTGLKGKSVLDLSREILIDNQSHLSNVARLSPSQIIDRYKGIGQAKAITLLAALELGSRAASDAMKMQYRQISCSADASKIMQHHFQNLDHEEFWAMLLNNGAKIISEIRISEGGQTGTVVDIRKLMRAVLQSKAVRMILFHNHPSGTLRPSGQDDSLTKKIKDAAAFFDIRVDDHIIITDRGYYSYSDEGRI